MTDKVDAAREALLSEPFAAPGTRERLDAFEAAIRAEALAAIDALRERA